MLKIIRKADIILLIILLILGAGLSIWSFTAGGAGEKAVVTVDGKLYGTYSLAEDQVIEIKKNHHLNKITIKGGAVQMSYSDCHNQVCVKDGKITEAGRSIVCLPNRVMVEIQGGKEKLDAVAN